MRDIRKAERHHF